MLEIDNAAVKSDLAVRGFRKRLQHDLRLPVPLISLSQTHDQCKQTDLP